MSNETAPIQETIDAVEAQAKSLQEKLRSWDADVEKWASKRDSLNDHGKKLRAEVRNFKAQRDLLHEKIQAFIKNIMCLENLFLLKNIVISLT